MNIELLKTQFQKAKLAMSKIEELLADYDVCKSEITKKIIGAAIDKYTNDVDLAQDKKINGAD